MGPEIPNSCSTGYPTGGFYDGKGRRHSFSLRARLTQTRSQSSQRGCILHRCDCLGAEFGSSSTVCVQCGLKVTVLNFQAGEKPNPIFQP